MTVSAQTPINRSTGNGVTTVFPYTFKIISDADIEVTVDDVVKTLNVDYTVTGAGVDAGGNVTMTTAPATATTVIRRRNMAIVRTTDYQDQGALPAATLDSDIDASVLMAQQLSEQIGRSLKFPVSDSVSGVELPPAAQRVGKALVFDTNGDVDVSTDDYVDQLASVTAQVGIATPQAGISTASAAAATATLNDFKGRYYGALSANPVLDPLGAACSDGDLYFNTATNRMMAYAGGTWYATETLGATDAALVSYTLETGGTTEISVESQLASTYAGSLNAASLQNWQAAAADINVRDLGTVNSSTPVLPRTATMSQSGTTVTASSAFFEAGDEGRRIVWADGSEAVIRTVTTNAPTLVTTCTVDRTQTVGSQSANVNAKGLTLVYQGDSIGYEAFRRLVTKMYRAYGCGGFIATPIGDQTLERVFAALFSGGAAEVSGADQTVFPQGQYWSVPAGGTLTTYLAAPYTAVGAANVNAFDPPTERDTDTSSIIWQRAAGSITIQRKRYWEKDWETVTTIADTSAGSTVFGHYRAKHTLGNSWQYRVLGVSGTVNIVAMCQWNRTNPGFTAWSWQLGAANVDTANTMPAATLKELCDIINPDLRTYLYADYGSIISGGSTMAVELAESSALWDFAAPRCDTLWMGMWNDSTDIPTGQPALDRTAVRLHAISRGDPYIDMFLAMGSYAKARSIGLNRDSVHQTVKGGSVTSAYLDKLFGFLSSPLAYESRNVNASAGKFKDLQANGRVLLDDIRSAGANAGLKDCGAQWLGATCYLFGAMGASVGTNDFTVAIKLTVPSSSVSASYVMFTTGTSTSNAASQIQFYFTVGALRINLRNAANTSNYSYQLLNVSSRYAGKTGWFYLVSDRSRNCFTAYFDTEFGEALYCSEFSAGTATENFTSGWNGTGTNVIVASDASNLMPVFGLAVWPATQLTKSQIEANVLADRPVGADVPNVYYNFKEQAGRQVLDRSGNLRHGTFVLSSTNKYLIGAGPTWLYPQNAGFAPPISFTTYASVKLLPNENGISNHTSLQTLTLPDTPEVGDKIRITGKGAGKWKIGQPALHQIFEGAGGTIGTNATTIGTGGSITAANRYDMIELVCITSTAATAYEWAVVTKNGLPTWV